MFGSLQSYGYTAGAPAGPIGTKGPYGINSIQKKYFGRIGSTPVHMGLVQLEVVQVQMGLVQLSQYNMFLADFIAKRTFLKIFLLIQCNPMYDECDFTASVLADPFHSHNTAS